jgi:hypothetical protein
VRVGADQRIRVEDALLLQDALGQVLQVHLVHDADARRHHAKAIERLGAPLQKLVARAVTLELHLHVELERVGHLGKVHLHGVVYHQVDRHERLYEPRLLIHAGHGGAHGGQVHKKRHPCKVLEDDARDGERNLGGAFGVGLPVCQRADVVLGDALAIHMP